MRPDKRVAAQQIAGDWRDRLSAKCCMPLYPELMKRPRSPAIERGAEIARSIRTGAQRVSAPEAIDLACHRSQLRPDGIVALLLARLSRTAERCAGGRGCELRAAQLGAMMAARCNRAAVRAIRRDVDAPRLDIAPLPTHWSEPRCPRTACPAIVPQSSGRAEPERSGGRARAVHRRCRDPIAALRQARGPRLRCQAVRGLGALRNLAAARLREHRRQPGSGAARRLYLDAAKRRGGAVRVPRC